jgi:hypothetical protein
MTHRTMNKKDAKTSGSFLIEERVVSERIKMKAYTQAYSLTRRREKQIQWRTALIGKIHNVLIGSRLKLRRNLLGTQVPFPGCAVIVLNRFY